MLIDRLVSQSDIFNKSNNANTLPIKYNYYTDKQKLYDYLNSITNSFDRLCFVFDNSQMNNKYFLNSIPFFTNEDINLFSQNESDINKYSKNVVFIVNLINNFNVKNIDFLACNSLQYSEWKIYYDILTKFTSVIVGASNDLTGNLQYGGNWILENTNENIKNIYFNGGIDKYSELLVASSLAYSFQNKWTGDNYFLIKLKSKCEIKLTNLDNLRTQYGTSTEKYVIHYRKTNTVNWYSVTNYLNLNIILEPNIMYEFLILFEATHKIVYGGEFPINTLLKNDNNLELYSGKSTWSENMDHYNTLLPQNIYDSMLWFNQLHYQINYELIPTFVYLAKWADIQKRQYKNGKL